VGIGSLYHVLGEHFAHLAGAPMTHVPYKGMAPLSTDLAGGQVDVSFIVVGAKDVALVEQGRLKILATLAPAGKVEVPMLKAYRSINDSALVKNKDFAYNAWTGYFVRKDTPEPGAGLRRAPHRGAWWPSGWPPGATRAPRPGRHRRGGHAAARGRHAAPGPARRHGRAAHRRGQGKAALGQPVPARCTPAATTATPPCCWPRRATWPARQLRRHLHLIFQPAEEGLGGARSACWTTASFERFPCDAMFAMHNMPGLPQGRLVLREGAAMASSDTPPSPCTARAATAPCRSGGRPGGGRGQPGDGAADHRLAQRRPAADGPWSPWAPAWPDQANNVIPAQADAGAERARARPRRARPAGAAHPRAGAGAGRPATACAPRWTTAGLPGAGEHPSAKPPSLRAGGVDCWAPSRSRCRARR
jgi:hypothetical protein